MHFVTRVQYHYEQHNVMMILHSQMISWRQCLTGLINFFISDIAANSFTTECIIVTADQIYVQLIIFIILGVDNVFNQILQFNWSGVNFYCFLSGFNGEKLLMHKPHCHTQQKDCRRPRQMCPMCHLQLRILSQNLGTWFGGIDSNCSDELGELLWNSLTCKTFFKEEVMKM